VPVFPNVRQGERSRAGPSHRAANKPALLNPLHLGAIQSTAMVDSHRIDVSNTTASEMESPHVAASVGTLSPENLAVIIPSLVRAVSVATEYIVCTLVMYKHRTSEFTPFPTAQLEKQSSSC
jgi:hypothetical protein